MDLVSEIRADSSIPIIVASARKNEKDRVEALSRGAYDYLTKPFDPTEMLLRLRTILNSETPTPTTPAPISSLPSNNTVAPKRNRRTASVRNPELKQTTPMPNPPVAVPPILLQALECQRNQVCR
jgi:two-component system KDP operon response regulator KdpE